MRSHGATLVRAADPQDGDVLGSRIRTAGRLCARDPNAVWTNQYANVANPMIHEIWTGPELLAQLPSMDALFIGASTGGTLRGISRAARNAGRNTKVIGIDVVGSRVFGGEPGPRLVTGIGASRPSRHLNATDCDAVAIVPSWDAVMQCRQWKDLTGLALGGSSGAVLAATLNSLASNPRLIEVACLCPDFGENYLDTIYDDRWVDAQRAAAHLPPPNLQLRVAATTTRSSKSALSGSPEDVR